MLTVGFDLDMTLIDSRPGIRASLRALTEETGVPIDADVVIGRLGPKLEWELGSETLEPLVVAAAASSEPHSPHSGQRPSHFGDSWAQPVHR